MPTQKYSVIQPPIETIFTWIKSGEIAIPEIQRPFVWDKTKVRNLLDSLYKGFPIGYLIIWKNPDVRLKDGTISSGKKILIDGQQRIISFISALLGKEVINKDYKKERIKIAFNPIEEKFEVSNPAIEKDKRWISDISVLFDGKTSMLDLVNNYYEKNMDVNKEEIFKSFELLKSITSNQIGIIELDSNLDMDTITEIFIRVNSEGVPLSQADFAMSKIAVNEKYGGSLLRKAIDYFCHMAVVPDFYEVISQDKEFCKTEYFPKISWLKNEIDDIYDPSYTDLIRVAFTSEFKRGKLEDLVALLSGRNFETKEYEERIIEDTFARLKEAISGFMNETYFKRFVMIIKSAGFIDSSMIRSQNTLNFSYILYLTLRSQNISNENIERIVRKWFVMSILLGRYSGSPESMFDYDIRQIHNYGAEKYLNSLISGELSDAFWTTVLPQELDTSVSFSPYFSLYLAAQVKSNDKGFLSKDITIRELIEIKSDVHHIFPKKYLKEKGFKKSEYNQVANLVLAQSEINIAIGKKEPNKYFKEILEQCNKGKKKYGNIACSDDLKENFIQNCIPDGIENMTYENYQEFLQKRRKLMAQKIKNYFQSL